MMRGQPNHPQAAGVDKRSAEHTDMAWSRLISSEQSVVVRRPIEEMFNLLLSAPAWSSGIIGFVDESPPDAPYSLWRYKVSGLTGGVWYRNRVVTQEPPRRLGVVWRPLGVIPMGYTCDYDYTLTPVSDNSVTVTSRTVVRISYLNPHYWSLRASKVRARHHQWLLDFGVWAESYEGTIPIPIETSTSEAAERARQSRPRQALHLGALVTGAILLSWMWNIWPFFILGVVVEALCVLDSFASNRNEKTLITTE